MNIPKIAQWATENKVEPMFAFHPESESFMFRFCDMIERFDDADILAFLGDNIDKPDAFGSTILQETVRHDRLELCRALLERGANADIAFDGACPLLDCITSDGKNSVAMFKLVMAHSRLPDPVTSVDHHTGNGDTMLHEAVRHGRLDIAQFLIDNGARPDDLDMDCYPVWREALDAGGEALLAQVEAMLPLGANWTRPNIAHHKPFVPKSWKETAEEMKRSSYIAPDVAGAFERAMISVQDVLKNRKEPTT